MPVRFLIIRFSSIGDIVLTTPVIRCLKQQVEGAEVHYLTKKQFVSLLDKNPYIDKLHLLEDNLNELLLNLENENFDYIIDLHNNLRSSIVKRKLRIISFSFNKLNLKKWLLVNFKINRMPHLHIVDRYMETLKVFDVKNDNLGLDYFIPEDDIVDVSEISPALKKGYVVIVLGANHKTKQIPNEKIIEVANGLSYPVILIGGPDDTARGNEIASRCKNVYNVAGNYYFNQSASVMEQSEMVITPDTGMMHIAAALKKNIISVWGNTVPEFGMFPYQPGENSEIFEVKGLSCRPCSKLGFEKCPKKHFRCMLDHDTGEIIGKAKSILASG
ncbi:MAG: glycosyltransferase family 9 protein [bacterium]